MSEFPVSDKAICHINLARGYRGGERQTEILIREMASRGYPQRLIARKGQPLANILADVGGLEIIELDKPFLIHSGHCADNSILHVHEAKAGHLACLANSRFAVPYVVTRRVDKPPRASFLNRRLYTNAGAVIAVSRNIAGVLESAFPGLPVSVIPDSLSDLAVDSTAVASLRQRFAGKFVIGHAGALVDRHKGQLTLIEAMKTLGERYPELQVVLLGEGEDEGRLKEAAKGMTNIRFEGFVSNLGDYLQVINLFVYPSRYEGLGSVLLDAMHAGLPVIASRVGGIPEIVEHEHNGLLFDPGNAADLAQSIERIYQDKALLKRLSSAAKAHAKSFSPASMADAYMDVYQNLDIRNDRE